MATPVPAIDQDAAHAHLAHLAERDLERPAVGLCWRVASGRTRHAAIEVFSTVDAAEKWFEEKDPEGVAFEYDVIEE